MARNQIPPSPEHVGEMLSQVFSKLDKKYIRWYKEMYELAHDIAHGNIKQLPGKDLDEIMKKTTEFEKMMRTITSQLISKEKIIRVEKKEEI